MNGARTELTDQPADDPAGRRAPWPAHTEALPATRVVRPAPAATSREQRRHDHQRAMNDMTGLMIGLDVIVLVVLVSLATGETFVPVTAMVIAPLAACAYARPATTLFTTSLALAGGVAIGVRGGLSGTSDLLGRTIVIAVGGCVGTVLAALRERRERSLAETDRKLRAEHEVVSVLQESFLPGDATGRFAGVELASTYRPVNGRVELGGDWFDVFPVGPDRLGLSIGDVAGHGVDSAVLMVQLRLGIRLAALQGLEPGEVLTEVSRLLSSIAPDAFATAIFALYEPRTHELSWSRSGHCLPLLVSASGAALLDDDAAPPLGVGDEAKRPTVHTRLEPGEVVVLHTDGLYERRGSSIARGEQVLVELVPEVLREHHELQRLVDWLPELVHDGEPEDDICVLALRATC